MKSSQSRIADALERIAAVMESNGSGEAESHDVSVSDSIGSCPECDSLNVMQRGAYPSSIYQCKDCSHIWVNDADAFFGGEA